VQVPENGLPSTWDNGMQVNFLVASKEEVQEIWRLAIRIGGTDYGKPGFREYASDFYAIYSRDPEGNKLYFVHASEE
jgi:predicted lactoylglutathione lyase